MPAEVLACISTPCSGRAAGDNYAGTYPSPGRVMAASAITQLQLRDRMWTLLPAPLLVPTYRHHTDISIMPPSTFAFGPLCLNDYLT